MIRGYRGPKKPSINQPRVGNILDPLGDGKKWTNVWGAVMNVPQASGGVPVSPTPTPTASVTPTPGLSPSPTPSITPTNTVTPSVTPSITPTNTVTPTASLTPSVTPTTSATPTPTPSPIPPSATFINTYTSTANQSTYNFTITGVTPGLYVIQVGCETTSAGRNLTAATFDGQSMVVGSEINPPISLAYAYVNTSSSGTITLSLFYDGSSIISMGFGLWKLNNVSSTTPIQIQSAIATSGTVSITFTGLTANNVGIIGNGKAVYNDATTWTNATVRYDIDTNPGNTNGMRLSGADFVTSTSGNRTVSVDTTTNRNSLMGLVWN